MNKKQKEGLIILGAAVAGIFLLGGGKGKELTQFLPGGGGGGGNGDWSSGEGFSSEDYSKILSELGSVLSPPAITIPSPSFPEPTKYSPTIFTLPSPAPTPAPSPIQSPGIYVPTGGGGGIYVSKTSQLKTIGGLESAKERAGIFRLETLVREAREAIEKAKGKSGLPGGSAPAPPGMPAPGKW
ncbi:MAG: hypothetical protein EFT35_07765 [Methanophagales archaeon ANME-1-THS]|nr:MAG: hypothetical protein EFT35_07765 [Methanophagales archaeon ANME-1-THS]